MIRRPPRSTQSRSSAASDVYKRQILSNRTPLFTASNEDQEPTLSPETEKNLMKVLRLVLNAEVEGEYLRQRLSKRRLFSVHEAFRAIDRNEKGFITSEQFRKLLEDYGIFTSTKDIQHLMQRFDKDKDGSCLLYTSPSPRDS
eukprot:TRINITY_DN2381_c0_g1_i10.p1 TRINITY_DN2381_c0_g1~~TRINITY_DN2381_c0_g1_i10.p1  ORF type:complete len:143 (+),score=76.05 TRINITY_DN2381_c0_g1_i10:43-471(+)